MHRILQTDTSSETGNCFQACLASLLERKLDEIPHFMLEPENWSMRFGRWLEEQGLFSVECRVDEPPACLVLPASYLCILTGPSPRYPDVQHSVIGLTGPPGSTELELIHDPHPDQNFFEDKPLKWIMFIGKRNIVSRG